ncbi:MAG: hypothetical protein IJ728_11455 [Selenomonadaceae bacterium]|nr:hypothetical protein [Selenomonadaceae bacterium]
MKKFLLMISAVMTLMISTAFAAEENNSESYKYISLNYDFSIQCPKVPKVVPAEIFFDDNTKKGDVLVFDYVVDDQGAYDVKRAWIFLFDAFNTNAVPNFNQDKKEIIDQYLTALQKNGYEGTALVNITKDNKGVFAITAKVIEIDEDDDGKPDATLETDQQSAVAFFRTASGRCVSIQLIGSNDLNDAALNNFRRALTTFEEVDLKAQNSKVNDKDQKKSDKKSDKKSKKDKKK